MAHEHLNDPITPASAADYLHRLDEVRGALLAADLELDRAWRARNEARWPGSGLSISDMRPIDDPLVVAAEARIVEAQKGWRVRHAAFVAFVSRGLADLRCNVTDYRCAVHRPPGSPTACALPAGHGGRHDWERAYFTHDEQAEAGHG